MSNPIADLSYRNYDGPLESPQHRWWAIAKMTIRLGVKKKGFWWWSTLSAYWYLILIAVFYFTDSLTGGMSPDGKNPILSQIVWRDQFVNGFSISQLLLFIVALLIGVGTIANDNRANALLVYLSKPCSKLDYLIGKWMGIAIPITLVSLVPTLIFYMYGALTYADYGFLDDKFLVLKLIAMCSVSGIVHASLCLGISSMFNQGRLAGATYAGLYFFGLFFTKAMQIAWIVQASDSKNEGKTPPAFIGHLYYTSIDGLQIGLAKILLNTNGSAVLPGANNGPGRRGAQVNPDLLNVPAPPALPTVLIGVAICVVALLIAWRRVRAVEVVG